MTTYSSGTARPQAPCVRPPATAIGPTTPTPPEKTVRPAWARPSSSSSEWCAPNAMVSRLSSSSLPATRMRGSMRYSNRMGDTRRIAVQTTNSPPTPNTMNWRITRRQPQATTPERPFADPTTTGAIPTGRGPAVGEVEPLPSSLPGLSSLHSSFSARPPDRTSRLRYRPRHPPRQARYGHTMPNRSQRSGPRPCPRPALRAFPQPGTRCVNAGTVRLFV